jgi:hypothetical protein
MAKVARGPQGWRGSVGRRRGGGGRRGGGDDHGGVAPSCDGWTGRGGVFSGWRHQMTWKAVVWEKPSSGLLLLSFTSNYARALQRERTLLMLLISTPVALSPYHPCNSPTSSCPCHSNLVCHCSHLQNLTIVYPGGRTTLPDLIRHRSHLLASLSSVLTPLSSSPPRLTRPALASLIVSSSPLPTPLTTYRYNSTYQ